MKSFFTFTWMMILMIMILAVIMLSNSQCRSSVVREGAYAEAYESTLSLPDREFVQQIIDPPPEFNTVKLRTYSTSLQTGGNWGRGCECNFSRPSDGRGFQLTGYD